MIYDHSENRGNTKLIMAESGRMVMSEDERFLLLYLFKGSSYEEQENKPGKNSRPLLRTEFAEELVRFDLSSFKMTRTNEQLFKDNYQMLNLQQLSFASDSLEKRINDKHNDFYKVLAGAINIDTGKLLVSNKSIIEKGKIINTFPYDRQKIIVSSAISSAKNIKNMTEDVIQDLQTVPGLRQRLRRVGHDIDRD